VDGALGPLRTARVAAALGAVVEDVSTTEAPVPPQAVSKQVNRNNITPKLNEKNLIIFFIMLYPFITIHYLIYNNILFSTQF
jgi:hypothetical protein